jgi:cation diffusion facilitator CzcD-associated flavoprotein CzcO
LVFPCSVFEILLTSLVSDEQREQFVSDPFYYQKFRQTIERDANSLHSMTLRDSSMQMDARDDFTALMKKRLAKKPEIMKSILPNFSVGCRRLTPGPGYLEALVEDNVDFIDTPITKVHPSGVELKDGTMIELDALICATGFNASAPPPFPVVGREGQTVQSRFEPYPETYLSMTIDGYPNLFMMLGPNSAIGSGSLTMMMEMEGDYIIKCIRKMQKEDIKSMEVKLKRVKDFSQLIETYFKKTVYLENCRSWY